MENEAFKTYLYCVYGNYKDELEFNDVFNFYS